MENDYTSKDIMEMAAHAKSRGVELYIFLARNSENYHVGKLFAAFAKDEQKHKKQFEKRLGILKKGAKAEEAYPGERSVYLKALVDDNAFKCGAVRKRALEKTISEEEALQAGINFEKDFMLFLHELKRDVAEEGEKTVDTLIEEEIDHLKGMFKLRDKLSRKK